MVAIVTKKKKEAPRLLLSILVNPDIFSYLKDLPLKPPGVEEG